MHAVSALHVVGVGRREHRDPELVAPELAVRLDVDDPVRAQRRRECGGVHLLVEIDRADDQRALGRIGDERRRVRVALGPPVQVARGLRGAGDHRVEPAPPEHPLELVGEQQQRRDRRGVVRLVLDRVLERGLERQELGDPPLGAGRRAGRGDLRRSARAPRGSAAPAIAPPSEANALLRGEVVDVGLLGIRAAVRRRRRCRRSARARRSRSAGRATGTITPVEVSLCAHAITSAPGSATGSGASPGSASTTIGSARNGAPRVTAANFELRTRRSQVQRPLADQAARGRVPERGRAAVAEHDLVAVGQREQLPQARCASRPTSSFTGFWRWEVPITAAPALARCSSCSGRTREGPDPKRPSAGFSSRRDLQAVAVSDMRAPRT